VPVEAPRSPEGLASTILSVASFNWASLLNKMAFMAVLSKITAAQSGK
jgi:hypothetical protein